jgi:hypothetical protein
MKQKMELLGKTISGIVAAPAGDDDTVCIWMMQFTDGTHVEFVSPNARRALKALAGGCGNRPRTPRNEAQLALNVA